MTLCLVLMLALAPVTALKQKQGPSPELEMIASFAAASLAPKPKIFHAIPKNGQFCLEGTEDYLQNEVLVRLKASNMQTGWMTSKIEEGTCDDAGYWEGPNPHGCFPEVSRWLTLEHIHEGDKLDMAFVKEYYDNNPELKTGEESMQSNVECMAEKVYHMHPKNSEWCYQGNKNDLLVALKRLKSSNLQNGWPVSYPVLGACPTTHASGPYSDICWPALGVWMDMKGQPKLTNEEAMFKHIGMDMDLVKEYEDQHPAEHHHKMPNVECLGEIKGSDKDSVEGEIGHWYGTGYSEARDAIIFGASGPFGKTHGEHPGYSGESR